MAKILLVEDEADLRFSLVHNLGFENYTVVEAADGALGWSQFQHDQFDLIILDIMLPEMDGLTLLKKIRAQDGSIPILMLTAKATEMDKVIGFELGADDYLTKPFGLGEFLARVKALLRRRLREPVADLQDTPLQVTFLDFQIDFKNYEVRRKGEEIKCSQKELHLLRYLIQHAGQAVDKSAILEAVWGYSSNATTRTIDTHIARLRRKLDDRENNRIIQTVPTVGYKFVASLGS